MNGLGQFIPCPTARSCCNGAWLTMLGSERIHGGKCSCLLNSKVGTMEIPYFHMST